MTVSLLDSPRSQDRAHLIDVMRMLLAFWVLLAHMANRHAQVPKAVVTPMHTLQKIFQPIAETHPAVLMFIVLSGYCIHRNGLRGAVGIQAYGVRRAFRILPVFVVAAFVGALVAHLGFIAGQEFSLSGFVAKLLGISAFWAPWNSATWQG